MEPNQTPRKVGVAKAFTRRLINDGSQIESRCNFCGAAIVGSAMYGLDKLEEQHFNNCPKISRD
jgi:hypothetical protein